MILDMERSGLVHGKLPQPAARSRPGKAYGGREMSVIERLPITPETVTVLGRRVKANSPMWAGLDLANADLRMQASILLMTIGPDAPVDLHLSAPWWHPEDGPPPSPPEMWYRVRPRMQPGKKWKGRKVQTVQFERWSGKWCLAIEYAQPVPER
jgi:hypothetical protein